MSVRLDSVAGSLGRGANGVADRRQLDVCRLHHPTSRFKAHKISHSHSIKRQRLCPLFASADHAPPVEEILDFKWEEPSTDGRLIIAPLAASEVGAASVVLTRAFATSPQGVPIEDGRKYCEDMLSMPPKGVFLVGRLHPDNPATAESWLPPGQTSRLVATASISFHPDSRDTFQTLQPPDADAYLCNIAVDPKFRRRGLARRMLAACEAMAADRGFGRFYLHVRLGDDAARALYETSGYREVDTDTWLLKLRGITPKALLVKDFNGRHA